MAQMDSLLTDDSQPSGNLEPGVDLQVPDWGALSFDLFADAPAGIDAQQDWSYLFPDLFADQLDAEILR